MRKYTFLTLIIALLPTLSFGASRYTQLVREKQQKMEQLEKCMGAQKGLKIAGISTIGLTAVGVAGNIYEAKVIKDNEKTIEKTDKQITETKQQISEKLAAKAKKEQDRQKRIEQKAQQASEDARKLNTVVLQDIENINALGGNIGDKAIARGYQPEQLPTALSSQFATAMMGFIERCYGLKKAENGIETVSAGSRTPENWESFKINNGEYTEETVLPDLNENVIAECKVETCNETTHTKRGDRCVEILFDCTEEAKKKDANVVAATMNDGKCEIQQCTDGFEPNEAKTKCEEKKQEEEIDENTDDDEIELSQEQKMDCLSKIMRDFPIGGAIPERYMSKYNEYLNELQNRVADKDGFIQFEYNGLSSMCTKGQKWSQCTSANIILPAIARNYIKEYAENQECHESNDLSWTIGIEEHRVSFSGSGSENTDNINARKKQKCIDGGATDYDPVENKCVCPGDTVWSPSMRECQSPETAAANAEFDKNFEDCIKHGASGYSVERGVCLCEDETLYEYDGTKCVRKQEKTIKISAAELNCKDGYWNGNTCECPSYKPYWDATNYECMENPVPSAPAPMGQILAAPQVEEAATTTLPDRSATSYFAH